MESYSKRSQNGSILYEKPETSNQKPEITSTIKITWPLHPVSDAPRKCVCHGFFAFITARDYLK